MRSFKKTTQRLAILTLTLLFLGGVEIPAPGIENCGEDPTPEDPLDCFSYPLCF